MMFPLAALCGFDLNARLFSIEPIDDSKDQSGHDSDPDVTEYECNGGAASDD
jgi:hypothetical protein